MHNHKRRREIFFRTLIYLLMTLAVLALVTLSLFLVLGYSVDEKTGRAEQGGLIQFRSFPDGASVRVDGAKLSANTATKTNATTGQHSVTMERKDYRAWSKSFSLNKGELLWLNALLIPKSITTNEVQQFDELAGFKASPDKKWIVVLEKANEPTLKIIDLSNEKKPRTSTLKIPGKIANTKAPGDSFQIAEWDFGSRYILVKHVSGETTEWLRVDRTDENNTKNISSEFKLNISEAHFVGTSGNVFFALSQGYLRKLTIDQNTSPSPIASGVREFQLYKDDRIAFVSAKDNEQTISVYREGNEEPIEVKHFDALEPAAHVSISSYFEDDYLSYSHGDKAVIIQDPFDAKIELASVALSPAISWLYFSNNGQFLIAQNGSSLVSYNLERNLESHFTIPGNPPYTKTDHLKWLDDFHLWSDIGGTLNVMEFDGANAEVIGNVTPGFDVTLSDNGKRLFSVGTSQATKKPVLQSSVMVLE